MKTSVKFLGTVFITACVVGSGIYYYLNRSATADKNKLQSQINELQKQLDSANNEASTGENLARLMQETSGWTTYTDKSLNFTLKYPTIFQPGKAAKNGQNLDISVNKISSLNYPLGDNASDASARKSSLLKQQFPENNPLLQSFTPSHKVFTVSQILGIYAANQVTLQQLEATDVEISRQTIFYVDDYEIVISSQLGDAVDQIPTKYLKTDPAVTMNQTQKIWGDQAGFYTAVSNNQLSGPIQDWYTNYDKIISTIRLSGDIRPI